MMATMNLIFVMEFQMKNIQDKTWRGLEQILKYFWWKLFKAHFHDNKLSTFLLSRFVIL